jgi:hypothetical protein
MVSRTVVLAKAGIRCCRAQTVGLSVCHEIGGIFAICGIIIASNKTILSGRKVSRLPL